MLRIVPARNLVIVNPESRSGRTGRRWASIESRLRDALADQGGVEVERTRGPRDAARIAREAVRAGVERLIVAGGDGTTSEVVSGLLAADLAGEAQIGSLPLGSGGDLRRTLAMPRDLDAALAALREGGVRRIDAGRIRYRGRDGQPATNFFLNVASFGISGLVDELVNQSPKAFGGTFAFLVGTLRALARYRPADVTLRLDGDEIHRGSLTLAAAANGCYFGGGMHVAPAAEPDDGLFDVVVADGRARARLLTMLPSLYRGAHLAQPGVRHHRGVRLEADAAPGEVWLDVDGEVLGTLPATLELLPGAVVLFGVPGAQP